MSIHYVYIHIIWAVKDRVPFLEKGVQSRLFEYMNEIALQNEIQILELNGVEDHVHLLLKLRPVQSIANITKTLKGKSSFWVNEHEVVSAQFNWQDGYSAFSVSPRAVQRVRNYIRNQEMHHKEKNFHDELKMITKETVNKR